jgi:hypothetical protein
VCTAATPPSDRRSVARSSRTARTQRRTVSRGAPGSGMSAHIGKERLGWRASGGARGADAEVL